METTYSHLSDDDYIQKAEEAVGIREPEDEESLTPNICPTCDEMLDGNAKACPACGTVFAPDAQALKEQMDDDLWESKSQANANEDDAIDTMRRLIRENPKLIEKLTQET